MAKPAWWATPTRRVRGVVFDVDHAKPKGNVLAQFFEGFQLIVATPGKLQHEMVYVEGVQKVHDVFPKTLLDGLAAIVTKA